MHTLMTMGQSAARRLTVTLLSVVLPVAGDRPVQRTAEASRRRQLETVSSDDLTADVVTANQVRTVTFGLDGTTYEIDLSPGDAAALRDDLATWVSHARRTSGSAATSRSRRPTTATTPGGSRTTTIRRWARANGHNVSDRGRLPAAAREAYDAAH